jgi:hypothetical protein
MKSGVVFEARNIIDKTLAYVAISRTRYEVHVYTNYREELERSLIPHFATWVTELTTLKSRRTEDDGSDTEIRLRACLFQAVLHSVGHNLNSEW